MPLIPDATPNFARPIRGYGQPPVPVLDALWTGTVTEHTTVQYMPVIIDERIGYTRSADGPWVNNGFRMDPSLISLPPNLECVRDLIETAVETENRLNGMYRYVYLTVKRGFARPGAPLNREGWHTDGFGTGDVNYVLVDRFPTVFAVQEFHNISDDHNISMYQFTDQIIDDTCVAVEPNQLYRMDNAMVHRAPTAHEIARASLENGGGSGGMRTFIKVSFSNEKYNLIGNAHNYTLDYGWDMVPRQFTRNDPAGHK